MIFLAWLSCCYLLADESSSAFEIGWELPQIAKRHDSMDSLGFSSEGTIDHLEGDDADAPHVGFHVVLAAFLLFWTHVDRRAHVVGQVVVQVRRQPL